MSSRNAGTLVALPWDGRRLNLELVSRGPRSIRVRAKIDQEHLDASGRVATALISSIADLAARYGASEKLKADPATLYVANANFTYFGAGSGAWLSIDAVPLGDGNSAAWQVSANRGDGAQGEIIAHALIVFQPANTNVSSGAGEVRKSGIKDVPSILAEDDAAASGEVGDSVADQRRRQIFIGACKVVAEKGYAATSIRDIAKAAKLPISTMYQYINSKEDILFMITKGCMDELFAHFEQSIRKGGKATDKIKETIEKHVAYISKNRKYINLIYRETKSLSPTNREKIFDLERQVVTLWEKILVEGRKSGEFIVPDPSLTAHYIYFLCNVWALRHWAIGDRSEKEVREMICQFALGALNVRSR